MLQKFSSNTVELQPKKRLHAKGVDLELLRLLCRHMVNLRNQKAAERFWNAPAKLSKNAALIVCCNFEI
jgi:hypothetical protein